MLQYDPENNLWTTFSTLPQFGTAGAALASRDDQVTVVNGEKKPGLRTAVTLQFTVEDYGAHFTPLPDLAPADDESIQEGVAGAGKGCSTLFCMTIGTSIGGALIVKDRLVSGVSHAAGEVAYMRVQGGILHSLASTTYLVRLYAEKAALPVSEVNGVRIFDAAERGESLAVTCIDALVEHLSDGICNVITVVNPEAVILGGGIMARSAYLRPRLEKALQERLKPHVYEKTRLEFAALKNEAGMLGALYNYLKRHS